MGASREWGGMDVQRGWARALTQVARLGGAAGAGENRTGVDAMLDMGESVRRKTVSREEDADRWDPPINEGERMARERARRVERPGS